MLSIGGLLSDLSAEPGPSVVGRLGPFVLIAFLILAAVALFFALRGATGTKNVEEDEEHDSGPERGSPSSGDET